MATELLPAIVTASGAISVAGASYWFTKKREHEADLRKEKVAHYKDFGACLSGVISGEFTPVAQRSFAIACNKLNLVASQPVIHALQKFHEEIKASNDTKSQEAHDRLMSEIFFEMRKDLRVKLEDEERASFTVGLWASGQPPKP